MWFNSVTNTIDYWDGSSVKSLGGPVTGSQIADGTITNADVSNSAAIAWSKLASVSASGRLLGRHSTGSGAMEEISLGSGLSLSGGILSATGTGGTVTSVGVSVPSFMTSNGGPITSNGTINLTFNSQSDRVVLASPADGSSGSPSFRQLRISDIRSAATGNPSFLAASGACPSGQMLNYNSVSDRLECQSYSLADNSVGASKIQDNAVTSAKIADGTIVDVDISASASIAWNKLASVSAPSRLLGRSSASSGPIQEIEIGSGLQMVGNTLSLQASDSASWTPYAEMSVGNTFPTSPRRGELFYRSSDRKLFRFQPPSSWVELPWQEWIEMSPDWSAGRLRITGGELEISPNGTNWYPCIPAVGAYHIRIITFDNVNSNFKYFILPSTTVTFRNINHIPVVFSRDVSYRVHVRTNSSSNQGSSALVLRLGEATQSLSGISEWRDWCCHSTQATGSRAGGAISLHNYTGGNGFMDMSLFFKSNHYLNVFSRSSSDVHGVLNLEDLKGTITATTYHFGDIHHFLSGNSQGRVIVDTVRVTRDE
jgi:hypothetical protein